MVGGADPTSVFTGNGIPTNKEFIIAIICLLSIFLFPTLILLIGRWIG